MTTARTGLMLYSVRRACAEDFEGTLRAVAAMGYTGVELFDLHGHDALHTREWRWRWRARSCERERKRGAILGPRADNLITVQATIERIM